MSIIFISTTTTGPGVFLLPNHSAWLHYSQPITGRGRSRARSENVWQKSCKRFVLVKTVVRNTIFSAIKCANSN